MSSIVIGEDRFESWCDLIEVSCLSRPDTSWMFIDAKGHEHQWFADNKPATAYRPTSKYSLPTLAWVVDEVGFYEDGESYEVGHYECSQCGEHVKPRSTSDTESQYIQGIRHFAINGEHVSQEEFRRRLPKEWV